MKKLVLLFSAAVIGLGGISLIKKTIPGTPLHIAKVVGAVQDKQNMMITASLKMHLD